MAMIDCDECGKPVSSGARSCPHCGVVMGSLSGMSKEEKEKWKATEKKGASIFDVVTGILIVGFILLVAFS